MINLTLDYDAVLDAKFGKKGTPSRAEAEEKVFAFYNGKMIEQARKEANMTQVELAEKLGSTKSYISRVENEYTEPKVSTFYRIAAALGYSIEFQSHAFV